MYSVCSASGVTASFGEMLLLMAIHFHSNQLSAICELVCSTLGMKVSAEREREREREREHACVYVGLKERERASAHVHVLHAFLC